MFLFCLIKPIKHEIDIVNYEDKSVLLFCLFSYNIHREKEFDSSNYLFGNSSNEMQNQPIIFPIQQLSFFSFHKNKFLKFEIKTKKQADHFHV